MPTPYGLDIIESCASCTVRSEGFFCGLPDDVLHAFESLRTTVVYPRGSILFVEGQSPRGVHLICTGRAKLSTSSADGKTLIVQIAEPGEVLGASATISGGPHDVTAETLSPCQMAFIKREDFVGFLSKHGDASLKLVRDVAGKDVFLLGAYAGFLQRRAVHRYKPPANPPLYIALGEQTAVRASRVHVENIKRYFLEPLPAADRERFAEDLRILSHAARDMLPRLLVAHGQATANEVDQRLAALAR